MFRFGLTRIQRGSFSSYPGRTSTLTVFGPIKDLEFLAHLFERPLPDGLPVFEGAFLIPPFFAMYWPPMLILISEIRELARLWLSPTTLCWLGVLTPRLFFAIHTCCGLQNLEGLSLIDFMHCPPSTSWFRENRQRLSRLLT